MRQDYIISILVENQSTILTRILGLFTGCGFYLESITIGSTEKSNMSRIILVVPSRVKFINQLIRQLYKLLPVIKIENLTYIPSVKRELLLCKIFAVDSDRTELLEVCNFFGAKIIDFTSKILTLEISGNPEKILAFEQIINKFGIIELYRTGLIALSRESAINTAIIKPKTKKISKLNKFNFKKLKKNIFLIKELKRLKQEKLKKSYLDN